MNKNLNSSKKLWRTIGFGLLGLLIAASAGFLIWASTPATPEPLALESLGSTEGVHYQRVNDWLVFTPSGKQPKTGLVIYPGGRVDARAYAAHAQAISEAGHLVTVVPMPLNFAFFGVNRASEVISAFPVVEQWVVGGHSLGGAMAAEFVKENPSGVKGLLLWASYPAESTDLTQSGLSVMSIYASNDGLATLADIDASRSRLPESTIFVEIEGGNHAGFGWYGSQNRDGEATITKTDQQEQIVNATVTFLDSLGDQSGVNP